METALHDLFALDTTRFDFAYRLNKIRDTVVGAIAIEEDMLYPSLAEAACGDHMIALGHKIEVWLKTLTLGHAAAA